MILLNPIDNLQAFKCFLVQFARIRNKKNIEKIKKLGTNKEISIINARFLWRTGYHEPIGDHDKSSTKVIGPNIRWVSISYHEVQMWKEV